MLPGSVLQYLESTAMLHARYRDGQVHVHVPDGLQEANRPIDDLIAIHLPISHAALNRSSNALFYSLPVAFDPTQAIGPYLATADRNESGEPFRFLDMGALIATQALGENDPAIVQAVLAELPVAVNRYAHSEYQTSVSLRMKAALDRIAPAGTPRHFVVNTGAEAVENAIKAVLLSRVRSTGEKDGGFILSFEGAYHGRTLGSLAVTHRKRARLGFPTFDWPQAPWPSLAPDDGLLRAREERSLRRIWSLFTIGQKAPRNPRAVDQPFVEQLARIDAFLERGGSLEAFVAEERARVSPDVLRRALRCAAVLAEPIQGEGGIRLASARFFRRLRVLTRVYDVPLLFDEIQTGFGATGLMWAHEHFELPAPPDVVTWAKKAQNGVLFVSEELAAFFQEEKKFNTTWEGDAVGMVRLMATIDRVRLEDVARTGALLRARLERMARDFPELLGNVRGLGVMLGFDVVRPDWSDPLRDRAFRRGLLLLPAGERTVRFYPRYDTEPSAIDEALSILGDAIDDLVGGRLVSDATPALRIRVGTLTIPVDTLEVLDLTTETFEANKTQILQLEQERYDPESPLLKYPSETLEATLKNPRAIGIGVRDRVSGRLVGYALGSALEDHDEEGISSDPRVGENDTFYLQALVVPPSVQNAAELENFLLDTLRPRAVATGYEYISTLIESRVLETAPDWFKVAVTHETLDNYLGSGATFAYLQAPLKTSITSST